MGLSLLKGPLGRHVILCSHGISAQINAGVEAGLVPQHRFDEHLLGPVRQLGRWPVGLAEVAGVVAACGLRAGLHLQPRQVGAAEAGAIDDILRLVRAAGMGASWFGVGWGYLCA